MIESIVFVVRKTSDELLGSSRREHLYLDGNHQWSSDALSAWTYQSIVVFHDAEEYNGEVLLRLPSGREVAVLKTDFFDDDWSSLLSVGR